VLCPLSCSWPSWQHAAIWLEPRVMGTCPDMPDFWQAATDAAENQVDKAMDAARCRGRWTPGCWRRGGRQPAARRDGRARSGIGGARSACSWSWSSGRPLMEPGRTARLLIGLGAMQRLPQRWRRADWTRWTRG
jgi:hypothetical protein